MAVWELVAATHCTGYIEDVCALIRAVRLLMHALTLKWKGHSFVLILITISCSSHWTLLFSVEALLTFI